MTEERVTELDLLKERADRIGISYHPSIGVEKLKAKIENEFKEELVAAPIVNKKETIPQRNNRLRREANRLIRARITCMNPSKKNWFGEVISVSNNAIGKIKKFIPFNNDEGYHIPKVLYDVLQERKFPSFYTVKIGGKKVKKSKLVKEFAIEELPNLTEDELKRLAAKQLAEKNNGE